MTTTQTVVARETGIEPRWGDGVAFGLALAAVAGAVFSRLVVSWGFPSVLNFVHFPIALLAFTAISHPKVLPIRRTALATLGFAAVAMVSGVVNGVELTRMLAALILWIEPILIAYVVWVALIRSPASRNLGRSATLVFAIAIFAQGVMMTLQIPRQLALPGGDQMQGTFLGSGIGAHAAPAVAFLGIIVLLESATLYRRGRWLKLLGVAYGLVITSLALARVVTAIFAVALLVGTVVRSRGAVKGSIAAGISLLIGVGLWLAFPLLADVPDIERQLPGWEVKASGIQGIVEDVRRNATYAVVGHGPGTTISRVAMETPDASLNPDSPVASLGLGTTEFTRQILSTRSGVSIARSSLFTPASSLLGVLGDLGLVGFVLYLGMWLPLLRTARQATRASGRYAASVVVLATVVLGTIQNWLEEPGYVLLVALLLALIAGDGFNLSSSDRAQAILMERVGRQGTEPH